jgi:cyclophilin family peptidyl-prolyl cis-trans isomerase
VKKNFYNGQRFHRAEPKFLVQIGDPVSRDMSREEWWGRQGTGKPIGVAEVTKKRGPTIGAVGMAYPGTDKLAADSQFFILRRNAPELAGKYTIFGKVLEGMDVVQKLQKGDMLKRASVKP